LLAPVFKKKEKKEAFADSNLGTLPSWCPHPYFYPATPSYPYIFLFYVINIKRKRDGGVVGGGGGGKAEIRIKRAGHPPYIFLFYVINIKRKRDGGLRVKKI